MSKQNEKQAPKEVNIKPGTDLNEIAGQASSPDTTRASQKAPVEESPEQEKLSHLSHETADEKETVAELQLVFPETIYQNLPTTFKESVLLFQGEDLILRSSVLINNIAFYSAAAINVQGGYNLDKKSSANLYLYNISLHGEGKGVLSVSRCLVESIHHYLKGKSKEDLVRYEIEKARYEMEKSDYDPAAGGEMPTKPHPPRKFKLFIPLDNSNTGFKEILDDNYGRGIAYTTEADEMVQNVKKEFGDYSTTFRKAYHHEPIEYYRRTNKEEVEIERPELSIVLSSTPQVLAKFFKNFEDGLASRFNYLFMKMNTEFIDVFDETKMNYKDKFTALGERVLKLYQFLETREDNPIRFELQPHQKKSFVSKFRVVKDDITNLVDPSFGGTVNRMGIQCFRIAMILTVDRNFNGTALPDTITCADEDFETAIALMDVLKFHTLAAYELMPKIKNEGGDNSGKARLRLQPDEKDKIMEQCYVLYMQGKMSLREISKKMFGTRSKHETVNRYIKEYAKQIADRKQNEN